MFDESKTGPATIVSALRRRTPLAVAAVASAAFLSCGPVLAQPAQQTAQSETGGLAEVVVTARYREENLQSTPLSITAITADDIKDRQFTTINDIGDSIPNAYFRAPVSNFGPTETIGLRGFTQVDFSYAFEPTVGFYIDDIYQGTLTGSSFDLADIERVEVLNGPQGTLFGKNTLGGAIRLITVKPKGDDTGSMEVTYGQHHRVDLKGIGDVSLIDDTLFMRVIGISRSEDAIGHYLDFTCEMQAQGQPATAYGNGLTGPGALQLPRSVDPKQDSGCALGGLGGFNHQSARVELRALPTSNLEVNVTAYYSKQADDPPLQTLLTPYLGTDFINGVYDHGLSLPNGVTIIPGVVFPKYGFHYTGNPNFVSPSPWDNYATYADVVTGQRYDPLSRFHEWGTSLTADYGITDKTRLKFITAYRTYWSNWMNDSDLTPFGLIQTQYEQRHRQFQDEIQLTSSAFDDRLNWTVGAFYYDSRDRAYNTANFDAFALLGILPNLTADDGYTDNNKSAFVHANYKLTERWSISGGLRYTDEFKTNLFQHYGQIVFPAPKSFTAKRTDWNADIGFQATQDLYFYAEAASGFTSPGFNPRISTVGQLKEVSGQEAINYEIGAKTDWLDHRLRVNASVFYDDYRKYLFLELATQCNLATDPDPGTPFLLGGGNCPAGTPLAGTAGIAPWFVYSTVPADERGAELQVFATPVTGLNINYTLGYIKFHTHVSNPATPGFLDESVRTQPRLNMSGGIQYAIQLGSGGSLTPRLDWVYQGYQTNGPVNLHQVSPAWIVPSYSLFNARIGYQPASQKWQVSLQGSNIFNKFYYQQLGAATTAAGTPAGARVGTPGLPRQWSVTFSKNF